MLLLLHLSFLFVLYREHADIGYWRRRACRKDGASLTSVVSWQIKKEQGQWMIFSWLAFFECFSSHLYLANGLCPLIQQFQYLAALVQNHVNIHIHPVPKLATPLVSNTLNSVRSSWISTKYRTLHYLNIMYWHTYYDVRTFTACAQCDVIMISEYPDCMDELDQHIIDKVIKQWHTCLRACGEAKGGHFEHNL